MKVPTNKKKEDMDLMENDKSTSVQVNGMGAVKIHENVISGIVRRTALEIKGVSRLAGNTLVDAIGEIVGSRRMQDRAITVNLEGDNRVSVDMKVIFCHDVRIPEVSTEIQTKVIESIEHATGMTVTAVNVIVQDIETPQEAEEVEVEEAAQGHKIIKGPAEPKIINDEDL